MSWRGTKNATRRAARRDASGPGGQTRDLGGDAERSSRGRRRGGGRMRRRLRAYAISHLQAMLDSLGRMVRAPFSAALSVAVIGIALAMPTGLHVILKNLQGVSSGWEDAAQISLFLKKEVDPVAAQGFADELRGLPQAGDVTYISPERALEEFRQLSGYGDVLGNLGENPLPSIVLVRPAAAYGAPGLVEALLSQLRSYPQVALAQLDMEWVKRLYALMEIGKRGVVVLAALLALAVLLILGNTIRLAIQNRRDEIEVHKLIGATDGFIRRPFLYSGLWHGLFGALVAWLLVSVSLMLLNGPVERLALLYGSRFSLGGLGWRASALLLLAGLVLGLSGAWLAVGRHLREIEPS